MRLTFNIWPNSKLEATKCVVPFAALYTPNKRLPNMPVGAWAGTSWPQSTLWSAEQLLLAATRTASFRIWRLQQLRGLRACVSNVG